MNLPHRTRRRAAVMLGGSTALVLLAAAAANAVVTTTEVSNDLGQAMAAAPASVTGTALQVDYPCVADSCPTAVSSTPMAGFPTNGSTFTILTTGDAALADDPNDAPGDGKDWGIDGTSAVGGDTHDYQVLRVDLGPATGTCLGFDFRFLSEEYPEFVQSGFNDAFVAQLNTWSVHADTATQTVTAPGNFAAGAGDVISVDGGGPSAMFDTVTSGLGTTYDGATPLLIARTPVAAGSTNTLYLTIFDQGDGILDSAVFLDNLRYESLPANQCKSLALDPFEGQTGVVVTPGKAPVLAGDKSSVSVPLDCTVPPGPVGCVENGVATFVPASARVGARHDGRAGAAGVTVASGSVTIPGGQSGTLVMPTTTAGKAALAKAAKAPAKLMKKAKKLLKKAHATKDPRKAAKLVHKAKKLIKKAKKLKKAPLGTLVVAIQNPANKATQTITVPLKR